jgi:hypothetical protein
MAGGRGSSQPIRVFPAALTLASGAAKTGPCDSWCDLAGCFWNFWYFENFVLCISYLFSVS